MKRTSILAIVIAVLSITLAACCACPPQPSPAPTPTTHQAAATDTPVPAPTQAAVVKAAITVAASTSDAAQLIWVCERFSSVGTPLAINPFGCQVGNGQYRTLDVPVEKRFQVAVFVYLDPTNRAIREVELTTITTGSYAPERVYFMDGDIVYERRWADLSSYEEQAERILREGPLWGKALSADVHEIVWRARAPKRAYNLNIVEKDGFWMSPDGLKWKPVAGYKGWFDQSK